MPFFTHHCQGESVARAVCNALERRGQGVVAITVSPTGLPTVWYRCTNDEQIIQQVRADLIEAEKSVRQEFAAAAQSV
jgi:hypothetical protein